MYSQNKSGRYTFKSKLELMDFNEYALKLDLKVGDISLTKGSTVWVYVINNKPVTFIHRSLDIQNPVVTILVGDNLINIPQYYVL